MIIGRPLAAMMFDVQEVVWVRERSSHALESWQWFHLTRVGKVAAANNCQQHNILRNTHTHTTPLCPQLIALPLPSSNTLTSSWLYTTANGSETTQNCRRDASKPQQNTRLALTLLTRTRRSRRRPCLDECCVIAREDKSACAASSHVSTTDGYHAPLPRPTQDDPSVLFACPDPHFSLRRQHMRYAYSRELTQA